MMYVVQEVDPVFAQSYLHLMELSSRAGDVDADIAALDLDFTIPGCPEAEMKVNIQCTVSDCCHLPSHYFCHYNLVFSLVVKIYK